jgi:NAD+ synthase (glutamine-hydrolysing)
MENYHHTERDGKSFPESPDFGFVRVAALSPQLHLANPATNAGVLAEQIRRAAEKGAVVAVCPELSLTGYSCGDLFHQGHLLLEAQRALLLLLEELAGERIIYAVGLPLAVGDQIYNVAAVCRAGEILGVVPKIHLPQRNEFYESRWFVSGCSAPADEIELAGELVPFGTDLLFEFSLGASSCNFGLEICEDLWTVEPPSGRLALAGAHLILNLSASPEVLGKADYRRNLVTQQSARCLAAYVYASSGAGESGADLLYGGHTLIAENGVLLAEGERFHTGSELIVADVDAGFLKHERTRNSSFMEVARELPVRRIAIPMDRGIPASCGVLLTKPDAHPFVPKDEERRASHCREIFAIQSTALARRLDITNARRAVIGLSGGLDSTLAFLVCLEAMKRLGRPAADILAVTMPGFGTTERTRGNASRLAALAGAELREISIAEPVRLHLEQIGQPQGVFDIAYENAQARERTQLLMDIANREGGLVVGTGDLSEAALGWCTFNGDHMSMFHVNAGVPKTLVRYLLEWCAEEVFDGPVSAVLHDVSATPISPELLPLDEEGLSPQETESVLGPYALHDFFLFHFCRRGAEPGKILWLAEQAWEGVFSKEEIIKWLREFFRRFFASQFKRNSQPDGPKVGSVALSPRGDWRMPSDASSAAWLKSLADDAGNARNH